MISTSDLTRVTGSTVVDSDADTTDGAMTARRSGCRSGPRSARGGSRPYTPCSAGIRPDRTAASRAAWSRSVWSA